MIVQIETATAARAANGQIATDNALLARLDAEDREALERAGKRVRLTQGQILFEPDDQITAVFFPLSGAMSLVVVMGDGSAVEALMVGREGATDTLSYAIPHRAAARCVVQLPGEALRVDAARLRELARTRPGVQAVMELHAGRASLDLQQNAACNAVHRLEPRLAKWLLNSHDRAGTEILPLTQEFLGEMLGAQRTTVTAVASALQKSGAIGYKRGRITVLSRPALERASCECYAAAQKRTKAALRPV
ncbi:MAG: Crp/Fnr family transcriptional regulator [Proteobacteria bacterium]|nr:Crp/Fnr family transcriptional regulator [Pseudomonadota bacterium]